MISTSSSGEEILSRVELELDFASSRSQPTPCKSMNMFPSQVNGEMLHVIISDKLLCITANRLKRFATGYQGHVGSTEDFTTLEFLRLCRRPNRSNLETQTLDDLMTGSGLLGRSGNGRTRTRKLGNQSKKGPRK